MFFTLGKEFGHDCGKEKKLDLIVEFPEFCFVRFAKILTLFWSFGKRKIALSLKICFACEFEKNVTLSAQFQLILQFLSITDP